MAKKDNPLASEVKALREIGVPQSRITAATAPGKSVQQQNQGLRRLKQEYGGTHAQQLPGSQRRKR